jgi:superfamily II DNA helicase RecQ
LILPLMPFQDRKLEKLADIASFCETKGCRREWLFSYFGEEHTCEVYKNSDMCDNCLLKRRADKQKEEREERIMRLNLGK